MEAFYAEHIKPVHAAVDAFPWEDRLSYGRFLVQTYAYTAHSTRLAARAASMLGPELEPLHVRFADHCVEEKGHHLLCERDLKALGYDLSLCDEFSPTSALYQAQYYKIEQDPMSLLGNILPFEGIAVERGKQVYARIVQAFGAKAGSFIRVHAEDDIGHLHKAFEMVRQLTAKQVGLIEKNFKMSVFLYVEMLRLSRGKA